MKKRTADQKGSRGPALYRIPTHLTAGCFSIVLAVAAACLIPGQIKVSGQTGITSRTIPFFLSGIIFLLGCWLVFASLVLKKEDYKEVEISQETRRGIFMGALAVYVFVMDWIGFLISSLLMGAFVLWYMEDKKPVHYGIVSACVAVIYGVFRFLLGVSFVSVWGV